MTAMAHLGNEVFPLLACTAPVELAFGASVPVASEPVGKALVGDEVAGVVSVADAADLEDAADADDMEATTESANVVSAQAPQQRTF